MFDLDLIANALDEAVSTAMVELDQRRKDYAGFEVSGNVALYEDAVAQATKSRDEFAKLRKAIESGVVACMCEAGSLHAIGALKADKPKLHALDNCDHVLLVNLDA